MNRTNLYSIAKALEEKGLVTDKKITDTDIKYISYNSRDIKPNTLFFCKGAAFNEKYLDSAEANGAVCYISEKKYNDSTSYIIVNDVRKAMALVAEIFYDNAFNKLNLVGITGTKGKSTTAYYVKYIVDEYLTDIVEPSSAIVSSIDTYDGVIKKESILTTPEALDLHRHFYNAVNSGIKYFTMEVSSQALKYDRVAGVHYKIGAYLNFGEDHISSIEHSDVEDYFTSKMKLFELCDTACINLDDETSKRALLYAAKCKKVVTFSQKDLNADFYGYNVKKDGNDITFTVKSAKFEKDFRITMPGLFNVYNALCAIAITSELNIPVSYMYKGLMKARASGRMEAYTNADKKIVCIVDYAHNSLSFENLYKSVLEEYKGRKIVTVFGCPGKKAINRRHDLGTLAGKYSDRIVITEEDFGEEPLMNICNDIAGFVKQQNCPYDIVGNRGDAIRKAILDCNEETVILITGKGNETRLKRGSVYEPCETDVYYAKKYMREYDIMHNLDKSEIIKSLCDIFPMLSKKKNISEEDATSKHLEDLNVIRNIDKSDSLQNIFDIMPALKKKSGHTIVIKYGGSALENPQLIESILEDIALLSMCNIKVVLVHGGGKTITAMLDRLSIKTEFVDGYRKTTPEIAEIAEMVLKGKIGSGLVNSLKKFGLGAVSISGKDGNLLTAKKKHISGVNIGMVGEVLNVDTTVIKSILNASFIPVISPIGSDSETFDTLNINADDLACSIAKALNADKLIFMTDMDGILLDQNNPSTIIHSLDIKRAKDLIESGFVGGGMIPKLLNCVQAVSNGVDCVSIIDGRKKHTILLESLSDKNYGTLIYKSDSITEKI